MSVYQVETDDGSAYEIETDDSPSLWDSTKGIPSLGNEAPGIIPVSSDFTQQRIPFTDIRPFNNALGRGLNEFGDIVGAAGSGTIQGGLGFGAAFSPDLTIKPTLEKVSAYQHSLSDPNEDPNSLGAYWKGAAIGLGESLPAIMSGPLAPLVFAGQQFGNKYAQGVLEDRDRNTNLIASGASGLVGGTAGLIPGAAGKALGKYVTLPVTKALTTLLSWGSIPYVMDKGDIIVDENLLNKTISDQEKLQRERSSIAQGLLMGGAVHGIGALGARAQKAAYNRENSRLQLAIDEEAQRQAAIQQVVPFTQPDPRMSTGAYGPPNIQPGNAAPPIPSNPYGASKASPYSGIVDPPQVFPVPEMLTPPKMYEPPVTEPVVEMPKGPVPYDPYGTTAPKSSNDFFAQTGRLLSTPKAPTGIESEGAPPRVDPVYKANGEVNPSAVVMREPESRTFDNQAASKAANDAYLAKKGVAPVEKATKPINLDEKMSESTAVSPAEIIAKEIPKIETKANTEAQTNIVDTPVQQVPAYHIATRPDLMQFKRSDNAKTGTNEEDQLTGRWDDKKAGNLLLWEPNQPEQYGLEPGQRFIVANGHHRFEFGQGVGRRGYNSQVIREADGIGPTEARQLAAEINIADGKGTIYDQAKFLRNGRDAYGQNAALEAGARIGAKGRKASTIAFDASPNLFDHFINKSLTPDQVEIIARYSNGDPSIQDAAIGYALKGGVSDGALRQYVNGKAAGIAEAKGSQGEIVLEDPDLVEARARAMAKYAQEREDHFASVKTSLSSAKEADLARQRGIVLPDSPEKLNAERLDAERARRAMSEWTKDPILKDEVRKGSEKYIPEMLRQIKAESAQGDLFTQNNNTPATNTTNITPRPKGFHFRDSISEQIALEKYSHHIPIIESALSENPGLKFTTLNAEPGSKSLASFGEGNGVDFQDTITLNAPNIERAARKLAAKHNLPNDEVLKILYDTAIKHENVHAKQLTEKGLDAYLEEAQRNAKVPYKKRQAEIEAHGVAGSKHVLDAITKRKRRVPNDAGIWTGPADIYKFISDSLARFTPEGPESLKKEFPNATRRETPPMERFFEGRFAGNKYHVPLLSGARGSYRRAFIFPKTLAEKTPLFRPIFKTAMQLEKVRDSVAFGLGDTLKPYTVLKDKSKVNSYLTSARMRAQEGVQWEESPEVLISKFKFTPDEANAILAVRDTMDASLDVIKDTLVKDGKAPWEADQIVSQLKAQKYVPFGRYGDQFVYSASANGGKGHFSLHDKNSSLRETLKGLQAQGLEDVKYGQFKTPPNEAYEDLPISLSYGIGELNPKVADGALPPQGFKAHLVPAKLTPGFEPNLERSINDYIMGASNWAAKKQARPEFESALSKIDKFNDGKLYGYAKRYIDYMSSNTDEMQKLRGALSLYYLGGNFKSAAVNLTQSITTTAHLIAKETGYMSMPGVYRDAMTKTGWFLANRKGFTKANGELSKAIDIAMREGSISQQMYREITGRAHGRSGNQSPLDTVMIAFDAAEKTNRLHAFIAGYEIAAKKGASFEERIAAGEKLAEDSQFIYSKANKPEIASSRGALGKFGSPLFTFRLFSGNWIRLLRNNANVKDYKVAVGMLGTMAALGGAASLPVIAGLLKGAEAAGYDPKKKIRKFLGDNKVSDAVIYGAPTLAGLNISGSIGIGELAPELEQGALPATGRAALGVIADPIQRVGKASWLYNDMDAPDRALETLMPEALRNLMVARRWSKEGVRSPDGSLLADKVTPSEIALKALGFTPSRIARAYEGKHSMDILEAQGKDNGNINFKIAKALSEGDQGKVRNLFDVAIKKGIKPDLDTIRQYMLKRMAPPMVESLMSLPMRLRGEGLKTREIYQR